MKEKLVEVAVFAPLRQKFLYRAPTGIQPHELAQGQCVEVPFGRSNRLGIITRPCIEETAYTGKLKAITALRSSEPLFDNRDLELGHWAANYYQHPLGEVYAAMLPSQIRKQGRIAKQQRVLWHLNSPDAGASISSRAKRQLDIVALLAERDRYEDEMSELSFDWRRPLSQLAAKGIASRSTVTDRVDALVASAQFNTDAAPLNQAQQAIASALATDKESFSPSLLHGVTGSGKTNVYIAFIAAVLGHDGQALLLLPEIAITQQLVNRFLASFSDGVAVSHSGMSDKHRADVWSKFRRGQIRILLGTRSAIWTSAHNLKCIIVDEEHDPSYKQLEGFRYNARDVAVYRASRLNIPVVLGSATPSFETYRNVKAGKYRLHELKARAAGATLPSLRIEDIRSLKLRAGLSQHLIAAIEDRLAKKQQTILFLNRRGYAPVMLCHQCGALWECDRCDSKLVLHRERGVLICHQCDKRVPVTNQPSCCDTPEMTALGQGTEQLAEQLLEVFPNRVVKRIDRDTVRKKSELDEILQQAKDGQIDILLGTQMLAKGHDFPNVTLVGIVDADARLFSLDFRAEERLAQLIIQVAGRAGRAAIGGEVFVQTRQPFHWIFEALAEGSYDRFLALGLRERELAQLPPYRQCALLRAEAVRRELPYEFLGKIATRVSSIAKKDNVFGPIPSQLERRAGKFRAELIFFSETRRELAKILKEAIECADSIPESSRVRWQIDVDPQDA
ncbi:MAG: primosomal protein N' [Gammaproteobacteria bacterium]